MKKKKFIFLILHYMNIKVTDECVRSLLKLEKQKEIQIVIVDNGSDNGTGKILQSEWEKCSEVDVVVLKKNGGFSRGNNEGFNYIRRNYKCDYIIVINSDIEIRDVNFCEKIEQIYKNKYFDVLGPDIFHMRRGVHQNPEKMIIGCKNDLEREIKKVSRQCKYWLYYALKNEIKRKIQLELYRITKIDWNNKEYMNDMENTIDNMKLHGACFIFSNKFIENNKKLFEPETFLYLEEDILAIRCKKEAYKMLYSPKLQVWHLGSASSNSLSVKGKKKYYERRLDSLRIVEAYLLESSNG